MDIGKMFENAQAEEITVEDVIKQLFQEGKPEIVLSQVPLQVLIPGSPSWKDKTIKTVFMDTFDAKMRNEVIQVAILYDVEKKCYYVKQVLPSRKLIYRGLPKGALLMLKFGIDAMPTHMVIKDKAGNIISVDEHTLDEIYKAFRETLVGVWIELELRGVENIWTGLLETLGLLEEAEKQKAHILYLRSLSH